MRSQTTCFWRWSPSLWSTLSVQFQNKERLRITTFVDILVASRTFFFHFLVFHSGPIFFSINFLFPFLLLVFFQVADTLNNPRCKKKNLQMIGGRYFLNHYVLIRVPDKTLSRNEITAISTWKKVPINTHILLFFGYHE